MATSLPYPDKPANGQAPDATPILQNLLALLAAINAFDGSQINAGSIQDAAFATNVNPRLRDGAWMANWVESGGYTSSFSGLTWVMPSGVAWYSGYRSPFTGQSYTVTASQDTYYFVSQAGAVTSSAVANNATAPSTPAGTQPLVKVISNATTITSIVDLRTTMPLNAGPQVKTYTPTIGSIPAGASASASGWYINLGGIKLCWINVNVTDTTAGSNMHFSGVTLPPNFFTAITLYLPTISSVGNAANQHVTGDSVTSTSGIPTSVAFYIDGATNSSGNTTAILLIGN